MESSDIIQYSELGFDAEAYQRLQTDAIRERMEKFSGRLYLEIGGKFFYDPHAARVLPGFDPRVKTKIFQDLSSEADLLFCVNARDIISNRQLHSESIDYDVAVKKMMEELEKELGIHPILVINRIKKEQEDDKVLAFADQFGAYGYDVVRRYEIAGYPDDIDVVLSDRGYGGDEYAPVSKKLVLVVGAASNSGKMSTCLGQMYHDDVAGEDSGYAKYETFPIWNLPLEHPVNLAYEAATADVGDYNTIDSHHLQAYGDEVINYNRDVDAFLIVKSIADRLLPESNFTRSYRSPTDMGINMAGFGITDSDICAKASHEEILRRRGWYQAQVDREEGEPIWVERCDKLDDRADEYFGKN